MNEIQQTLQKIAQRLNEEEYRRACLNNEQATKQWLILPMFTALGWDINSTDVHPEDAGGVSGKADYGLRIGGKVRVFVEAKALGKKLDDKDAEQVSNYANNKNVAWCVLTNEQVWRVYKTSGAVLSERLLFEVQLTEETSEVESSSKLLRYLSREMVERQELDRFGNMIFVDNRLRDVVDNLLQKPTQKFINVLKEELNGFSTEQIKEALSRLTNKNSTSASQNYSDMPASVASGDTPSVKPVSRRLGGLFSEAHHLQNKPQSIVHLFRQLEKVVLEVAQAHPPEIVYNKWYIGYRIGKAFAEIEIQTSKINLYLSLDPKVITPFPPNAQDVSQKGKAGNGSLRLLISSEEDIEKSISLIVRCYEHVVEAQLNEPASSTQ